MIEPTGYTALDLIGFTDRGAYDPTANYVKNDIVTVGNTKWRCKVDDTTGVTPAENANWTIYLESATSLAGMDDVNITTPIDDDGLVYNATTQKWKNKQITTKEQWKKNGAYNLCPNNRETVIQDGTQFTVNANKTITAIVPANPTTTNFYLFGSNALARITLPAGTYKFVGCPSGGNGAYYIQGFGDHDYTTGAGILDTGSGFEFTLTQTNNLNFFISIRNTFTSGGTVTFKPMITTDLNATYADYVPYAMTNGELTEKFSTNDFSVVREAFNLQGSTTKNITLRVEVSLLVGVYGSRGFAYLVHKNGGVYQISNSNDGITVSLYNSTLTLTNSGSNTYRTRLLELGQN